MALEIISPVLEFLANTAFAIRYGKARIQANPVSVPTASVTFLFFGFVLGLLAVGIKLIIGVQSALFIPVTLVGLFLLIVWRCGVSLGFQFSAWLAVIYAAFFMLGVGCVLFFHSAL